jgi:hypothetical protein
MGPPEIAKLSFVGDIHGLVGKKMKDWITPQVNFFQQSEKVVEAALRQQKGQRRWWRIDNFKSCMCRVECDKVVCERLCVTKLCV